MACGCRNARGGLKIEHKTRAAAVAAMATPRFLKGGMPHEAYPCPRGTGKWHVRTVRRRKT